MEQARLQEHGDYARWTVHQDMMLQSVQAGTMMPGAQQPGMQQPGMQQPGAAAGRDAAWRYGHREVLVTTSIGRALPHPVLRGDRAGGRGPGRGRAREGEGGPSVAAPLRPVARPPPCRDARPHPEQAR